MSLSTAKTSVEGVDARPFLKWVGGKRQIIEALLKQVPAGLDKHTYHEPFVGGGALFFALRPKRALLSDNNLRLVRTYQGVRDQVEDVIRLLRGYQKKHGREFFEQMRQLDPEALKSEAAVAAWMIYLNKTGFNGLYRVNSRNQFNVPFGRYVNPNICADTNLRACSLALQGVDLVHRDFGDVLKHTSKGDFVYFDPPYVPLSASSSFTRYTATGFGPEEQIRLRDIAKELKTKGVRVLLSNSGAGFVREIYSKGFVIDQVQASRQVNCKAGGRGKITELIIR